MTDSSGNKLGIVGHCLEVIKGLTFTNVLMIGLLILFIGPAYIAWYIIRDDDLLARLTSTYVELEWDLSECGANRAQIVGGPNYWYIRDTFRERGYETWYVGVRLNREPSMAIAKAYCTALSGLLAHASDPENVKRPTFPGTNVPIFSDSVGNRVQ